MFESLRKKFSETSGKLTKKLENEAEEEDNIESKETEDIITDVSDEVSSQFLQPDMTPQRRMNWDVFARAEE